MDLLWATVTRNVLGPRFFSFCDPNKGKISLTRTVISLSPYPQKQEMNWTLVLKFGNLDAGFQVSRNLRRNRSDESGHRKSSQRCRRYSGKFDFPDVTPEGQDPPAIETACYWQG